MAERHHAGAGRRQRPRPARRDLAADQQHAAETRARVEGGQAAGAGDAADQRIHRADAAAGADRQRALLDPGFFRRQSAAGARTLCAAFSGLPHLSDLERPDRAGPRADLGDDRKGPRRLVRRRRRHFRFPARCADDGSARAGPAAALRPARSPLCAEGPAVHRAADGEVARGHRVLSLPPPARAQRGRRRSGGRRAFHRCVSPDDAGPRQGLAARHDRDRDPRHQARRGRPRPPDGADAKFPANGPASWRAGKSSTRRIWPPKARCARRRRRSSTCCIRPCSAPGRCERPRRCFPGADAGLCAEGRARGQAGNQLAQSA